jgi:hypothetical protein
MYVHPEWTSDVHPRWAMRVHANWSKVALVKLLDLGHTFLSEPNEIRREDAWKEEEDHGHTRDSETSAARSE